MTYIEQVRPFEGRLIFEHDICSNMTYTGKNYSINRRTYRKSIFGKTRKSYTMTYTRRRLILGRIRYVHILDSCISIQSLTCAIVHSYRWCIYILWPALFANNKYLAQSNLPVIFYRRCNTATHYIIQTTRSKKMGSLCRRGFLSQLLCNNRRRRRRRRRRKSI